MNRAYGGLHTRLLLVATAGGLSACTAILGGFDFNGKAATGGSASTGGSATTATSTKATSGTAGASTSTTATSTSTATSTTTTSTSTTNTSTTSSTGTGGSPPSCTPTGSVLQVLSPTELAGATLDDGHMIFVSDPGGPRAAVHIAIPTGMTSSTIVASVYSQGITDLSTVNVTASDFTATAAFVTPGSALHVQGGQSGGSLNGFGQLDFQLDSNDESVLSNPAPTFTSWMTPPDCLNGYTNKLVIADPSASPVHYVASCVPQTSDGGMPASLWLATSASVPSTPQAVGMKNDMLMNPNWYLFMGGTHVVWFSGNTSTSFSWTSSNPPVLPTPPTTFTIVPNQSGVVLGLLPSPSGTSFLMEAASLVLPSFTSASLWTGVVQVTDLTVLGQTPPTGLTKLLSAATSQQAQNLGALLSPSASADGMSVYTAGQSLGGNAVYFSWLNNDASPIVLESPVYQLSMTAQQTTTIVGAGVGTLGPDALVAWIEKDTSSTPPTYTVNAHLMSCSM